MADDYYAYGEGAGSGDAEQKRYDSIIKLTTARSARDKVAQQLKMADQMRADAGSQLQGRQAGKTYTAPGWGNALASIANSAGSAYVQDQGMQKLDQIGGMEQAGVQAQLDQQRADKNRFNERFFGGGAGQPPTPQQPGMPPPQAPQAPQPAMPGMPGPMGNNIDPKTGLPIDPRTGMPMSPPQPMRY